jgi:ABC-type sulfate transport system permease component
MASIIIRIQPPDAMTSRIPQAARSRSSSQPSWSLLTGLPVASVGFNLFLGGTSTTWSHLASTVLPEYIANSLALCAGVGLGVAVVGVTTAWLTAMHDPGGASSNGPWSCRRSRPT